MATGNMLSLFPVLLIVFIGLWWDVHCTGYFCSEEYGKESFHKTVEMVAPKIEAYRSEYGHLPDTLFIEGLDNGWKENVYIDTTRWDRIHIIYHHWDDSAYALVHIDWWARYVSSPNFEGYLFYRWDEDVDSMRADTIFRRY